MQLFDELKRRNVFKVAAAYLVTAWLLAQIADVVLEAIAAPALVMQVFLLALALGFPIAVIIAWAFELTPDGVKRERDVDRESSITRQTGRKLDYSIIALLVVALGYFVWESRFKDDPTVSGAGQQASVAGDRTAKNPGNEDISSPDKSIAVLPFVNLSSDPEQEFFSDGISEELLNVLAQFPDLRVAARTSSFQFKGDNRDIGEIADLLKVGHVLEGSVRKSGTQLRITAQLIDAASGFHLWSQTYDRELADVFAIQDEISAAIGEALKAKLALQGDDTEALPRVAEAGNTAAYEAFLKGRYLINQRGNLAISEARRQLEKSVRLDPEFAPAHAQLAIAITLLLNSASTYGDLSLAEVDRLASPHIEKALALRPDLAEAYGALALLNLNRNNNDEALSYAEQAMKLNPAYTDVVNWKNNALGALGRYRESVQVIDKLLQIDPLSVVGQLNRSGLLSFTDIPAARKMASQLMKQNKWAGFSAHGNISMNEPNLADALKWYLRAYNIDPADRYSNDAIVFIFSTTGLHAEAKRISDATVYLAEVLSGNYHAAITQAERELREDPENPQPKYGLATALYLSGDREASMTLHNQLLADAAGGMMLWNIAMTELANSYIGVGEHDKAEMLLSRLEQDLESRKNAWGVRPSQLSERARIAALRNQPQIAIDFLNQAIEGDFDPLVISDPVFDKFRNLPGFKSVQEKYDSIITGQRAQVVDLICNNNPIPESWQPLRESCQG